MNDRERVRSSAEGVGAATSSSSPAASSAEAPVDDLGLVDQRPGQLGVEAGFFVPSRQGTSEISAQRRHRKWWCHTAAAW